MIAFDPVTVVAHWQTTAENLDTVLSHLAALRSQSLAEPGCLGYEALQSADDANTVVIIERYRDKSALDSHLDSPHYQDLVVNRVRPLLVDRRVEFLRPADL
jgi:quinol monooxygenase YgiN